MIPLRRGLNPRRQTRAADEGAADKPDVTHLDLRTFGNLIDDLGIVRVAALEELATRICSSHFLIHGENLVAAGLVDAGVERHARRDAGDLPQLVVLDVLDAQEGD